MLAGVYQRFFTHCKENPIYVFFFWELRGLSPNFHISGNIYGRKSLTDEYRNWETEHYNPVLEITVSFLGTIYKWEPDIDIGFSLALHLQCGDIHDQKQGGIELFHNTLVIIPQAVYDGGS